MEVSNKTKLFLWGRAAGTCEICAQRVDTDNAFRSSGNYCNVAHIKAQNEGGTRYDSSQTETDRHSIENLILLCPSCHKMIDNEQKSYFTTDRLLEIKSNRERNLETFAAESDINRVDALTYLVPVTGQTPTISDAEWHKALFASKFVHNGSKPFDLNRTKGEVVDISNFQKLADNLKTEVNRYVGISKDEKSQQAVFAIAPQPLLIKLGHLLGDKSSVHLFQLHRSEPHWEWRNSGADVDFIISENNCSIGEDALVVLSVSGSINSDSLPQHLNDARIPRFDLKVSNCTTYPVQANTDIDSFHAAIEQLLCGIHEKCPSVKTVHVCPALPTTFAITLGQVFNRNLINEMIVYEKEHGIFKEALKIGSTND